MITFTTFTQGSSLSIKQNKGVKFETIPEYYFVPD